MKQVCKYRKGADIMETVPGLGVNVNGSIESGVIKDTSATSQYNMQKDLSEVGSRVHEPFDVIEFERSYTKLRKYIKDEESKK